MGTQPYTLADSDRGSPNGRGDVFFMLQKIKKASLAIVFILTVNTLNDWMIFYPLPRWQSHVPVGPYPESATDTLISEIEPTQEKQVCLKKLPNKTNISTWYKYSFKLYDVSECNYSRKYGSLHVGVISRNSQRRCNQDWVLYALHSFNCTLVYISRCVCVK